MLFHGSCTDLATQGIEGVLVDLKDTIRSFKAIMAGEGDDLPEGAFYVSTLP